MCTTPSRRCCMCKAICLYVCSIYWYVCEMLHIHLLYIIFVYNSAVHVIHLHQTNLRSFTMIWMVVYSARYYLLIFFCRAGYLFRSLRYILSILHICMFACKAWHLFFYTSARLYVRCATCWVSGSKG